MCILAISGHQSEMSNFNSELISVECHEITTQNKHANEDMQMTGCTTGL